MEGRRRAAVVCALLPILSRATPTATQAPARPPVAGPAWTFAATRHADTTSETEAYRVTVRQLSGPDLAQGRLHYTVVSRAGRRVSGEAALARSPGQAFEGRIPGQPSGSTIEYWFAWRTLEGSSLRHPRRPEAVYRFRVTRFRIVEGRLPGRDDMSTRAAAVLRVEARATPRGEMILELAGGIPARTVVPMSVQPDGEPGIRRLEAGIPALTPGASARVWFRVSDGDESTTWPPGASTQGFLIRRSPRAVGRLPASPGLVLSLAATGEARWIGYRGGGLWQGNRGQAGPSSAAAAGFTPGVARFVLPDAVSGALYVGTEGGLWMRDGAGPWREARPDPAFGDVAQLCSDRPCRTGPGVLSPLDGSVLFQIEGPASLEQAAASTLPLLLVDGVLRPWHPRLAEGALAGLVSASFDDTDGCFLLGAGIESAVAGIRPAIVRRCGERDELAWIGASLPSSGAAFSRVTAVARDLRGSRLVFALEDAPSGAGARGRQGLYVLSTAGTREPAADTSESLGVEVTALVAERASGRLLVGTFGRGVLELEDHQLRPLSLPPDVSAEITAVAATDDGSLLVGTPTGAVEVPAGGPAARLGLTPGEGLAADVLPMDIHPRDGRVLLSSASAGLAELLPGDAGWRKGAPLGSGRSWPAGPYGDARYGSAGQVGALLLGRGLLESDDTGTRVLGTGEGLHSLQLLRLLARRAGGWWVAFAPLPFQGEAGAAVQRIAEGRVVLTLPVTDRGLATIGGWIESPDPSVVLAATRAGLLEISGDGSLRLLSSEPLSAIARDPVTGSVGVAGSAVGRWDGKRLVPVLYALPGRSRKRSPGDPFDIAIDRQGQWYLLYRGGLIAVLDPSGQPLHLLEPEDGIPPTARRLLAHPGTGEIFVGSTQDGLAVIAPADTQAR